MRILDENARLRVKHNFVTFAMYCERVYYPCFIGMIQEQLMRNLEEESVIIEKILHID